MASDGPLVRRWRLAVRAATDPALARSDVAVLLVVLERMNVDGQSWPALTTIESDARVSRRHVLRCVEKLVSLGYLTRESGTRTTSNRYGLGALARDADVPTGRDVDDTTCRDTDVPTGRDMGVPGVGTPVSPGVGTPMSPEPAFKATSSIEPAFKTNSRPDDRFLEFWKIYPRKDAKQAAERSWKRQQLDPQADRILQDVAARLADPGHWKDPRFIPHASTYLNQTRWKDEWQPTKANSVGTIERDARTDEDIERANDEQLARFGLKDAA